MERLVSFVGLFAMMGLAWLLSTHRRKVDLRIVIGGVLLQFVFAALIFFTLPGQYFFELIKNAFVAVIGCADAGSKLLFGPAVVEKDTLLNQFAFRALPTIIFFSSLMSVLYYFGVMQWIIQAMAKLMQRTLKTSGAETLSVAANVFVGQTEAPLVIRPYLPSMTTSELMAVMVGGFATVAGGVMATYITAFQVDALHLLIASVISAPAAFVVAKIMQPETEEPKTLGAVKMEPKTDAETALHAAANGAADGLKLALNVAAMLIAFLGIIAVIDLLLGFVGGGVAQAMGSIGWQISGDWKLQTLLGYLFAPLAWLIGVEWGDCFKVGQLLGIKTAVNEFVAYDQLHKMVPKEGAAEISARSNMLATYALCGFANFGSIGIQIGGIGPLAPERRGELARLGLRAMIGGTLAAFMTACVVGVLRYS